jgi:hypothetical protein
MATREQSLVAVFLYVRGNKNFAFWSISHAPSNVVGFIRTHLLPSVATRFTQNPFLNISVRKNFSFQSISRPLNNVRG